MPDKEKGFEISIDATKNLLRLHLWGFWDIKSGEQFVKEFEKKIEEFAKFLGKVKILR